MARPARAILVRVGARRFPALPREAMLPRVGGHDEPARRPARRPGLALGLLLVVAAASALLLLRSAPRDRPNIVLAIADDLDPDHLGFCGNDQARTPALDRLAARGVTFSVLYAQPVCRPALATLLSGRWPQQTGIVGNSTPARLEPTGALPALLREQGYRTFCGGKFWEGDIHEYGFTDPETNDQKFGRSSEDGAGGQAELFEFLADNAGRSPWFVWWAPSLPHIPHTPPEDLAAPFERVPVPVPAWHGGPPEAYAAAERKCLAMEAWLDAEFARLVAKLEELGELEHTVIVFLADNGWSTGLPSKNSPFEKGVRSPLVVAAPGPSAGRRIRALVDLVDVHATLLDYAGVPARTAQAGQSFRPAIEGADERTREFLCGAVYGPESTGSGERIPYALYTRDRRWKYVLYLKDENLPGHGLAPPLRFRRGKQALYDLARDAHELVDLSAASEQATRLARLRQRVSDWWRETGGVELDLDGVAR